MSDTYDFVDRNHSCGAACVCPIHGTGLVVLVGSSWDHACRRQGCEYATGMGGKPVVPPFPEDEDRGRCIVCLGQSGPDRYSTLGHRKACSVTQVSGLGYPDERTYHKAAARMRPGSDVFVSECGITGLRRGGSAGDTPCPHCWPPAPEES